MNKKEQLNFGRNVFCIKEMSVGKITYQMNALGGREGLLLHCKSGQDGLATEFVVTMSLQYFDYLISYFVENNSRVNVAACLGDVFASGRCRAQIDIASILGRELVINGAEMTVWMRKLNGYYWRDDLAENPVQFQVME